MIPFLCLALVEEPALAGWGASYIGCPIPEEYSDLWEPEEEGVINYYYTNLPEHETVRLSDLRVSITLHQRFAEVFIACVFENDGPKTTVEMSYPVWPADPSLIQIGVGDELPTEIVPAFISNDDDSRAVWNVDFGEYEDRTVWIRYAAGYGTGGGNGYDGRCDFSFADASFWRGMVFYGEVELILGPELTWEDILFFIGNGGFTSLPEESAADLPWQAELTKNRLTFSFTDYEPPLTDFYYSTLEDPLLNLFLGFDVKRTAADNDPALTASSILPPEEGHSYEPQKILVTTPPSPYQMDTAPFTDPWVEGAPGDGEGETLLISFPEAVEVSGLSVYNGYFADRELYWKNGRVSRITAQTLKSKAGPVGATAEYDFYEPRSPYTNWFVPEIGYLDFEKAVLTDSIELTLESVYRGASWDDTCLGGIELDYYTPGTHHRASSTLVESIADPFRLHAVKADDGDLATCWCEGVEGGGVGEWIEYWWEKERALSRVTITPGLADKEDLYRANARPTELELTYSTRVSEVIELTDLMKAQSFELNPGGPVTFVRMTIKSVYPGEKWDDCCIAEINFE